MQRFSLENGTLQIKQVYRNLANSVGRPLLGAIPLSGTCPWNALTRFPMSAVPVTAWFTQVLLAIQLSQSDSDLEWETHESNIS
jgi:hypothetical protein